MASKMPGNASNTSRQRRMMASIFPPTMAAKDPTMTPTTADTNVAPTHTNNDARAPKTSEVTTSTPFSARPSHASREGGARSLSRCNDSPSVPTMNGPTRATSAYMQTRPKATRARGDGEDVLRIEDIEVGLG